MERTGSLEKSLMLEKIERRRRRGQTEDEMVGWHHRLKGHEFEQALGVDDEQGNLVCCIPLGSKHFSKCRLCVILIKTRKPYVIATIISVIVSPVRLLSHFSRV